MNYLESEITHQTITGLIILITSIFMGIVGMFLFDGKTWGFNITLFGLLLIAFILIIRNLSSLYMSYREYVLAASGTFFILALIWRDSLVLNSLSYLGLLLTISLAFNAGTRPKLRQLEIYQVFQDFLLSIEYSISSYRGLIYEDIQWSEVKNRWGDNVHSTVRGIMVTIPMLLIFGLLLIASDARFEQAVHESLDWGLSEEAVLRFIAIFIVCTWFSIAILRGTILTHSLTENTEKLYLPVWRLGCIETGMILGAVNLLFLSFIAIQFTYFFGGDALVQSLDGLTYSNYARRGFMQLVAVILLVIVLLIFSHWLYRPYSRFEKKLYQYLSVIMIIMAMSIEASAAHRMYLYTKVYGFTELRFYTSIFMLWLVVLFIWFGFTILCGRRTRFIFGVIISGMFFIAALNFINPDAQIAKFNLARLQAEQRFDASYIASLSTDAVPAILANMPYIQERCQLWNSLNKLPSLQVNKDWRAFNLAQYNAQQLWLEQTKPNCEIEYNL